MSGVIDAVFGDGPSQPQPDPAIGQAALQNSQIAAQQLQVGEDQLAWNKQQYADLAPYFKKILDQQVAIGNISQDRADQQWNQYQSTYVPIEQQVAKDAMNEGSPDQQEAEADKARAQVANSYAANRAGEERNLTSMGVNPNSGNFAAMERGSTNAETADEAGAANNARTAARLRGIALRTGAAQTGRNLPQTGIASDSLALNSGTSAANTGSQSLATANAGVNSAMPWFTGATAGNQSAGNLMLGQYGGQLSGYNAALQAQAGILGGLGQAAGYIYGAPVKAARGGIIRRPLKGTGLYRTVRRGYAAGGIVQGPGDGSVDTVPAVVDGKQPAALANGEGVLTADAVKMVGAQFVHNINRAAKLVKHVAANGLPRGVSYA